MNNSASLTTLITQYHTLCQYCDDVFTETMNTYQAHMHCAKGCASCCILETVVPLEAYMIEAYQVSHPVKTLSDAPHRSQDQCAFLHKNVCTIYPARPIICRTHGLPLVYPDRQDIDACPLNFSELDLTSLDPKHLLDTEVITDNLIRLNLAFCIITGQTESAGNRVPLYNLLKGENYEHHRHRD